MQPTRRVADWLVEVCGQLEAESAGFTARRHLQIGGHQVCVRYQEDGLATEMSRATGHLICPQPGTPELTIDCWSASGRPLALPGGWPEDGTIHVDDGTVTATWEPTFGVLRAYDRRRRRAWTRFESSTTAAVYDLAAPFRRILDWWAAGIGMQFVHAAAVGRPEGGVLLVGRGGSGKSTTSLACLESGLQFAGDDCCLLAAGEPPRVHGLYRSAKGDARTAALLPSFTAAFTRSSIRIDGESIVMADRLRPGGISTGFPLRGIVIPRLGTGSVDRISPVGTAAALRALAPSTLLQGPGDRAGALRRLGGIVRGLPAWELALGPDPATAAGLIGDLLDGRPHP